MTQIAVRHDAEQSLVTVDHREMADPRPMHASHRLEAIVRRPDRDDLAGHDIVDFHNGPPGRTAPAFHCSSAATGVPLVCGDNPGTCGARSGRSWGACASPGASGSRDRRAILPPMSSKEMAAFLSRSSAFAGLPPREIEALARVAMEERHRARSTVFMEGDPAHWFYLVKTGHVKIVRHSKTGKDVVLEL